MDFLKSIGGRIVGGLVALGVFAAGISWFEMDHTTRQTLVSGAGKIAGWGGVVIAVPWVTFALIAAIARQHSNLAGGLLVSGYTILEALFLAWLFSWAIRTPTEIGMFVAAVLFTGVYNLFACDWIAEKVV